jgi:hypothetical protein
VDARAFLESISSQPLSTVTGRPNRIVGFEGNSVVVATSRSPAGTPVPIAWIQDALDRLHEQGEIEISVDSVGFRSAFVGAVLKEVPGAAVVQGSTPPRIRLTAPR